MDGCRYTKDRVTIHVMVDDEEQARSLIRSAIEGHPVFCIQGITKIRAKMHAKGST